MSQGILFKFYNSTSWKKVRELALQRDNYLCQKCLKEHRITVAEVVHHLHEITLENLDEYGLDLDNLISWCRDCHEIHHSRKSPDDEESEYNFDENGELILRKDVKR